jgi:hypothetical protein
MVFTRQPLDLTHFRATRERPLRLMGMKRSILFITILAAACGSKKDGSSNGGGETEAVALGSSGFVADVPKGWTVNSDGPHFYDFKDGGRTAHNAPQIMESEMPAGTVDDMAKSRCEGRSDIQKGTLPGNGFWVTCKGESKMMKGVQTTTVFVLVPKDDKAHFDCNLETDEDPARALAICKSIRKK